LRVLSGLVFSFGVRLVFRVDFNLQDAGRNEVVDPFNVFQNTPYYSLKALGCSKAGDYAEFENVLGKDLVVGLSCCPFEGEGFNGGKVTEVAVVTEE
jgi:uncharacterized protein YcgI (DUF1989 family)